MENYQYEVTIGMPVYGVEKYIRKCLESALNQTFQSIEYIMVDDRGPDKSVDIIRDIKGSHPRGKDIRIIVQPQNMGCWAARNTILSEAQGKYIFLMDSDDYISQDCIEVLYDMAERYNAEATLGSIQKVDDKNKEKDKFQYDFRVFDKEDEFATYANMKYQTTITNFIWNILIKADFLRKNQLQFPKTKFWDDVLFNANFQPLVTRAVLMPNITYYYVIRDNSLSSFENHDKINLENIQQHIANDKYLKEQCKQLKGKPYYEMRCAKEMLQTLYTIFGILKNRKIIYPHITNTDIRDAMEHPLNFTEIIKFKHHRMDNMLFFLLGVIPASISVFLMKIYARSKKLI